MSRSYHQPILKRDAQANVVQESYLADMKFRGEYSDGNLIYAGFARPGTDTSVEKWQIKKMTYSGTDVTQVDWAEDSAGNASSEFIFEWDERTNYTYS